jgi:hypothetical protein
VARQPEVAQGVRLCGAVTELPQQRQSLLQHCDGTPGGTAAQGGDAQVSKSGGLAQPVTSFPGSGQRLLCLFQRRALPGSRRGSLRQWAHPPVDARGSLALGRGRTAGAALRAVS